MNRATRRTTARLLLGITVTLLPFAVIACGNTEANHLEKAAKSETPARPIAVPTIRAEQHMLAEGLEVTGTLMADARTEVASDLDGRIVKIPVERGSTVAEGDLLAQLDDRDAANALREAEAIEAQTRERLGLKADETFDPLRTSDVLQARATLDRTEADYRRFAQLLDEGAVSRSEHDFKRADYLSAKAAYETTLNQVRNLYQQLQAQKARVAMARKALQDTAIRAPFNGLVAEKYADLGSYAKKGERLLTLVRVHPLRIELAIPEVAVAAVKQGQKVSFAVQSYPDRQFVGTIAYVGPALRAESRALVVEALVPNSSGMLRPGLFASARIELPAARRALVVPAAAVWSDAGVPKLYVTRNDRAELRIVQLGRELGEFVEVVRGLSAGERVVAKATPELEDGALITETR